MLNTPLVVLCKTHRWWPYAEHVAGGFMLNTLLVLLKKMGAPYVAIKNIVNKQKFFIPEISPCSQDHDQWVEINYLRPGYGK